MAEFLQRLSLFPLVLTLGAFQVGLWCQKKWKHPLANPILIALVLVVAVLGITGVSVAHYQAGTSVISWLLTPATVCMALPLYRQFQILRKNLPAVLAGVAAGTVVGLGIILLLCRVFSLDHAMTVALLPKSITTAMGIVLSEQAGGIVPLTTVAILITGILGSLFGPMLCKLLRITDPVAQGVAMGTASHMIGTSKALEMGQLQGAVSSLSLAVAGILTALLFPIATMLL
ncbi:MAG: LrgB family protein [Oscillospiraceae bacterium]|nr:LrgB family protein [Oscillospiraceae bacterium]